MNIEAVIPFCSYDEKFFYPCVHNLLKAGIKVNIITYTHLYAGEKEDQQVLDSCMRLFKGNRKFEYMQLWWKKGKASLYWEAWARYLATRVMVSENCDYVLYIDIDEIVEPDKIKSWIEWKLEETVTAYKLRNYIYWIKPIYRLMVKDYHPILCKYSYAVNLPFKQQAGLQYFNNSDRVSRWKAKLGINPKFKIYKGKPFIHHYSGVRNESEMKKKITNWSHNQDKDNWEEIIEKNSEVRNGRIGKCKFEIVDNIFNL